MGDMQHTQKMFLVPQHQLDLLKQQQQNPASIRQVAQNELDQAMANVLELPDTDMYEKAKKYAAILQRYLTLVKQGEREKAVLTLSLPDGDGGDQNDPPSSDTGVNDPVVGDVLRHIPTRSRRNAEHVLSALSKASDVLSWTGQGEVVINKQTVTGSHLYDLIKNVTAPYNVSEYSRPVGWSLFLKTLAGLNIPLSAIPNTQVRRAILDLKAGNITTTVSSRKQPKRLFNMSPSFSSPRTGSDTQSWLSF